MSNISKNSGTNVGIELSSIAVTGENGGRGECWKYNLNNQFPIIEGQIKNGKVTLNVDSPHKGYLIESVMKNGKMNGNSRILNPDHIEIGTLMFVDGIANGLCKLYDDNGRLFFEGCFVNGYREGKGKEFDEKGNVIYEGLFKEGKRTNMVVVKGMKGYWKEMNDGNEVISICEKNDKFENDGICYFYSNGNIDRISEWKDGEELNVLKRFEGKKMIEFVNGVKRYEGEYRDSIKHNYPREGKGDVVYSGKWIGGYRLSTLVLSIIITLIVLLMLNIVILLLSFYIGLVLLAFDIVFFLILGICYCISCCRRKKDKKSKNRKINDRKCSRFICWILGGIIFSIVFAVIFIIIQQIMLRLYLGPYSQTSMVVSSRRCNNIIVTAFNVEFHRNLESIEIGNDNFDHVIYFRISGLKHLNH